MQFVGSSTLANCSYADAPAPSRVVWDFISTHPPEHLDRLSTYECQPSSARAQVRHLQKFGLPKSPCPVNASLLLWLFAIGLALLPSLSVPLNPDDLDPEHCLPRTVTSSSGFDGMLTDLATRYLRDPFDESGTLVGDRADKHFRRPAAAGLSGI